MNASQTQINLVTQSLTSAAGEHSIKFIEFDYVEDSFYQVKSHL